MKIKTIACCLAALCLVVTGQAQDTVPKLKILKIYSNLSSSNFRTTNGNDTIITEDINSSFFFGGFSPALSIQNTNGNFHEFELAKLRLASQRAESIFNNVVNNEADSVSLEEISNFEIGFRYEASWTLKKDEGKFQPYIGLANLLHFKSLNVRPNTSASFPTRDRILENSVAVIPRAQFKLSKKLILDINIPITLLKFSYSRNKTENIFLSPEERVEHISDLTFLPGSFCLRIGIGFKLNAP